MRVTVVTQLAGFVPACLTALLITHCAPARSHPIRPSPLARCRTPRLPAGAHDPCTYTPAHLQAETCPYPARQHRLEPAYVTHQHQHTPNTRSSNHTSTPAKAIALAHLRSRRARPKHPPPAHRCSFASRLLPTTSTGCTYMHHLRAARTNFSRNSGQSTRWPHGYRSSMQSQVCFVYQIQNPQKPITHD